MRLVQGMRRAGLPATKDDGGGSRATGARAASAQAQPVTSATTVDGKLRGHGGGSPKAGKVPLMWLRVTVAEGEDVRAQLGSNSSRMPAQELRRGGGARVVAAGGGGSRGSRGGRLGRPKVAATA